MPYVQGDDLATVLRRDGKLPVARALRLAREIAGGLEAAHEAGVVHRDLKPANIMIGGAGDDEHALIMDFGISASADEAADGRIVGTLEYMSPEQGTGAAVDARSDLYAFGLILYEMLVGRRSAPATTAEERFAAMKQRFEEGLPPLRTWNESIPEPLAALVHARSRTRSRRALPDDRRALRRARRARRRRRADSRCRRESASGCCGSRILFLLVLLAGMYVIGRRFAPVAPPAARASPGPDRRFRQSIGRPGRSTGAVEQTLAIALEQASYITVFKTTDARAIAAQLAPGTGDRITEDVGQLIARREGIKVMVAGAIDKRGTGFRLAAAGDRPGERQGDRDGRSECAGQGSKCWRGRVDGHAAFARRSASRRPRWRSSPRPKR